MKSTPISLRDEVCHAANLATAYGRYARYHGLWAPGMSMQEVVSAPVGPMLRLAEELRSGHYQPCPPVQLRVAKGDGSQRCLNIYPLRDRVAQRAVLQTLQARTDAAMSPASFGYRPKRGVAQALDAVRLWLDRGYASVLDADIERCFDSIPRRRLLAEVERRTGDPLAPSLVAEVLGWRSGSDLDAIGIPQGAAVAPWLCNVYLWRLDDACGEAAMPLVRYADDFVVLALTRGLAEGARALCRDTLHALQMRLHPWKTRLLHASRPFVFLGRLVGVTPLLPCRLDRTREVLPCC